MSTTLLEQQINDEFGNKISPLDPFEDFYEVRRNSFELEKRKKLDSILSARNKKRKNHQRDNPKEVDVLIGDLEKSKSTKMIYEFHPQQTVTIKTLAVKKKRCC